MYYTIQNNNLLKSENKKALTKYYSNVYELPSDYKENKYIVKNGELVLNPNYEAQKAQEEHERIQELFMTRSDFFDATIKAFGADQNDFSPIIENILAQIPDTLQIMEDVSNDIAIKIALNNYTNAQDFYRKHPLFTILSNVPIQISEALTITITPEQWDKFFDEADKKNPDAYKELLPKEGGDNIG